MSWRDDPRRCAPTAARAGSGSALFSLRLAVQLPLYLAGALAALGVARIAMGIPLFAVGIWLSWLILRPPGRRHGRPSETWLSISAPTRLSSW